MNINDMTEKEQILKVRDCFHHFSDIKNPSEAVQLAGMNEHGGLIEYIAKPSEAVQLAAINDSTSAIYRIKNPSEKVQLAAISKDKQAYMSIKNPCEAAQNIMIDMVYNIKFFQSMDWEYEQSIMRVPGGWIYRGTFIPYISKKELKETLFNHG